MDPGETQDPLLVPMRTTASQAVPFISTIIIVVLIARYLLRRHFNQLRLPPGPKGWPIIGNLLDLGRNPHLSLTEMAKKYGNVFHIRFSTDLCYVLNDYDSIKKAFSNDAFSGRIRGTIVDLFTKNYGLIMSDGELWKEHRRFALSTLRDLGMGKSWLQERILEEVELMLRTLEDQKSQPYDPEHLVTNSVSNIICAAVFGKRFNHDDQDFATLLRLLKQSLKRFGQASPIVLFPSLRFFPYFYQEYRRMKVEDKIFFDNMEKMIVEARKPLDIVHEEFTTDYVNAFEKEKHKQKESGKLDSTFDMRQLKTSVGNMFVAGTETSSNTLLMGLLHMVENPDILAKVQGEIDSVGGKGEMVRMEHRVRLPYVDACLLELMRIAAVAPLGVFHRTMENTTLNGYDLPKNTLVISNLYAVHHDPQLWKNPKKFDPTRFIDNAGNFVKSPYVIPFSLGKRACLGENLAQMEMFLFFTNLLHKFDLVVPQGTTVSSENVHVAVTVSPNPYKLIFRPRF
ncbi:hypothetical protein RvY_07343 [Ramazzottius varieornatus]|uniref:Cytochrome P450 n=1 Tax=Ramazzottius varieornatus TaxID=947166 RepID=A0A1D1V1S8_RAMVA|nr:hypothetical protein RvY_07343 [Ramazzottius varieornatus]